MTPSQLTLIPLTFSGLAVCIAILSFIVAIKGYRRKSGVFIRGSFSIASASACNDKYVHEIILENLKDRAITIFAIYLRVGSNYYVELEDLEEHPLVLKPFEPYQKRFGPIEFYSVNIRRINLNDLLDRSTIKMQIILSTSDGKYKVPRRIRRWSPIGAFFDNHLTAIVKTIRSEYKGKSLGANIVYVVEFVGQNGDEEIVPIEKSDYQVRKFRNFLLTKDSLSSKQALDEHIQKQINEGKLQISSYKVHDIQTWRKIAHEFYDGKTSQAKYYTPFQYHILGRFATILSDRKMRRENQLRKQSPQILIDKDTESKDKSIDH
jgi:hypothetical protein